MLIIFSDYDFDVDRVGIEMFGSNIQKVRSGKHLGHLLSSSGRLVNIESITKDMKVRTNVITNQFYATSWQSKALLFNTQCMSLYGCQLWDLDDPKTEELCVAWRVCCRRLLGLHPRTHTHTYYLILWAR